MRLVVYTDYVYRRSGETIYAERAFALVLVALSAHAERLTIIGRLDPSSGPTHYPIPPEVEFVAIPHFPSLAHPRAVVASLAGSLRQVWRTVKDADCTWLLGPSPHAVAFTVLCKLRRRKVVLGVRQDYPTYVRSRRPATRWMHVAADLLEAGWRALARVCPVIVVGPELARNYRNARSTLPITVSLIEAHDVADGEQAPPRDVASDPELRLLSVGRLDREKNPLLLVEVLERLRRSDPRWRLIVCGEGPMEGDVRAALRDAGLEDRSEVIGYLALHDGLLDLYRSSHVFLHVSLTEGVPQVLIEAFASGLPVVATAVGGVPDAAGDAALLIGPADAGAAAQAVERIAREPALRACLIAAGFDHARAHTLERETGRVAAFMQTS
jgi:glycosyltransferase involved in cell wall biosynthesis